MRDNLMLYTPISTANVEDLSRRIVKEEIEKVLPRIVTCINDGPSDLEYIIREVRSNLTPRTREKSVPSPYRTKRTDESSWRPRPRPRQEIDQLNRIPEGRLTFGVLQRTAVRQRRGIRKRWDSDSVSDIAAIPNLTTSAIEVIRRTLDAIHNAVYQDLHLIAHLLGKWSSGASRGGERESGFGFQKLP
ncbi:CCHC-type domain-containing protein [Trichonephila clavipes]|nr:CCHC-type domain-containing protein [Trichonephila clavipes]